MKAGLDYRTIGRNAKGELEFFSSKPKLSTKPKRAIGKGLTRAEKEFSWNWYQNCAGIGSQTTDMYIRALREFSGRKDGKSTDLMVLKSYFSYGNTEQSRDAYINLKPFPTNGFCPLYKFLSHKISEAGLQLVTIPSSIFLT